MAPPLPLPPPPSPAAGSRGLRGWRGTRAPPLSSSAAPGVSSTSTSTPMSTPTPTPTSVLRRSVPRRVRVSSPVSPAASSPRAVASTVSAAASAVAAAAAAAAAAVADEADTSVEQEVERIERLWADTRARLRRQERALAEREEARLEDQELIERAHRLEVARLRDQVAELSDSRRREDAEKRALAAALHKRTAALDASRAAAADFKSALEQLDDENRQILATTPTTAELTRLRRAEEHLRVAEERNTRRDLLLEELEDAHEESAATLEQRERELEEARSQLGELHAVTLELEEKDVVDEFRLMHLQRDNHRLAGLLYQTGLFPEFFRKLREGPLVFVPPPGWREEEALGAVPAGFSATFSERAPPDVDEIQHWIPQNAFDYAAHFRDRYLPRVRADVFDDLLLKLNAAWARRHKKQVARLKARHARELRDLQRTLTQQQRYDDVLASSRVRFLEDELRKAQSPASRRLRGMGGLVLDRTLVEVDALASENGSLREENELLRSQTAGEIEGGDFLFLEGAVWAADHIVALLDRMDARLSAIIDDHTQRLVIEDAHGTPEEDLRRLHLIAFEDMQKQAALFRAKVRRLLDKVLFALNEKTGRVLAQEEFHASAAGAASAGSDGDDDNDDDDDEEEDEWRR